jgi:hypothetical protein
MKTASVLRKLICACVDDERTVRHERTFVDAQRAGALTRLARNRSRFVDDLEQLVGHTPRRSDGSWVELLREAARSVKVVAAGRNNGDAIATCRHSCARVEARFDQAMRTQWPDAIQQLLEAQQSCLHDESAELDQLQF